MNKTSLDGSGRGHPGAPRSSDQKFIHGNPNFLDRIKKYLTLFTKGIKLIYVEL
jgi:hypothetical protein